MKRLLPFIAVIAIGGCALIEFAPVADKVKAGSSQAGAIAENLTDALEKETGPLLSEEAATKGEKITSTVSDYSSKTEVVAKALDPFVPESPYKDIGLAVLGALTAVSGVAATWFRNRKQKAIQLSATIAENVKGGGAVATVEATKLGLAVDLADEYKSGLKDGSYTSK